MLEGGAPASAIKLAGCWASQRALSAYLQEAEAAAVLLRVSPGAAQQLKRLLASFASCLGPPRASLASILLQ